VAIYGVILAIILQAKVVMPKDFAALRDDEVQWGKVSYFLFNILLIFSLSSEHLQSLDQACQWVSPTSSAVSALV
jgi:hypothetical protein